MPPEHLVNVLSLIDIAANDLRLLDREELPAEPWMVDLHPDGERIIVGVGSEFRVYSVQEGRLALEKREPTPAIVSSFDVGPRGDYVLAVLVDSPGSNANAELHLFGLEGNEIKHLRRIKGTKQVGPIDRLFSPRISPDGTRAIVLNDCGIGGKGTLDDVLMVDLDRERPAVTERLQQIGDGLESVAFHPDGHLAVISCLEFTATLDTTSHLALVDLTTKPVRLLGHIPVDPVPEGIEFSADGSKLFVQATLANHIAVFEVEGFRLRRSPFVIRTGHAPASLAIARRYGH